MKKYLVRVQGDVQPSLKGPYKTESSRVRAARRIHRRTPQDGVYWLDTALDGTPLIGAFSASKIEPTYCKD